MEVVSPIIRTLTVPVALSHSFSKFPFPPLTFYFFYCSVFQKDIGVPKICTAYVGEHLIYFTAFKEKDFCVAVGCGGGGLPTPFTVSKLIDATLTLR